MTSICYYSASGGEMATLASVQGRLQQAGIDVRIAARTGLQVGTAEGAADFVATALACDAVVLSLHGGMASCPAWPDLAELLPERGDPNRPYLHLQPAGDDDAVLPTAHEYGDGLQDGTWAALVRLFDVGGVDNLTAALAGVVAAVQRRRSGKAQPTGEEDLDGSATSAGPVASPVSVPTEGLWLPETGWVPAEQSYLDSLEASTPTIGLLFPQIFWLNDNIAHVEALVGALRERGAQVIPVFAHRFEDAVRGTAGTRAIVNRFFRRDEASLVDAVINLQGFSLLAVDPSSADVFPGLGVPLLQAMTSSGERTEWEATQQGMPTMDVAVQAAHPEFDGALISRVVATKESDMLDPLTGALITRLVPIPDRVDSMADLSMAWARLRRLPAHERRIAVVFHHHPPRNDRIGCASGLDSFESVRLLLARMAREGYVVPEQFATADELSDRMLNALTCDQRWLTPDAMHARAQAHADTSTAVRWNADLPQRVQEGLAKSWGAPPGELFVHQGELSFAGFVNGNVFVTIQPPRGELEKVSEGHLHDLVLPPPHHYLAHYRWMRDVFGAHAVVHVGTHGSLEWLPGKALGLSQECYPELALADLPNIYPYIVNNPGEGTQAKRRSHCALVDHLTPPMRNAALDDQLALVDRLAREYPDAASRSAAAAEGVAEALWEAIEEVDLQVDLEIDRESALGNPSEFVNHVRHYLLELSDNAISDGLHVLGRVASDRGDDNPGLGPRERVVEYLVQLLRLPNGDVPSLRESVLDCWGVELATEPDVAGVLPALGDVAGIDRLRQANEACGALVEAVYDAACARLGTTEVPLASGPDAGAPEDPAQAAAQAAVQVLGCRHGGVEAALVYLIDDLLPRLAHVSDEMESVLTALAGGFVAPGKSGAPTRGNADILPTGRNFFSLDPRTLPTPAAWRVGVALAENLLQRYAQENPQDPYPRNVGIILWGTANMRSHGEDIAEILHLWGLRPRWAPDGHVVGVEVVPPAELGRPRIDVTPRISGFFRDAFPNLVELLDDAAGLVAALEEDGQSNFLRAHVLADLPEHLAAGADAEEAWRLATLRVFGCPPGSYGAGVEELVESKAWETKDDLAATYVRYSAHAYGRGTYGTAQPQAFTAQLRRMDATVKNEDSREYDMLSCTDFYNYYGGLIAAATVARGSAPTSFVGDSSDPRRARNRTTNEEARLVIRSRILNDAWISGLQRHGYKGAGDLSKVLDILAGWEATSDVVDDALWDRVARRYALDPGMQEWFSQVNPYALHNILDKLLDMAQRGLWAAEQEMRDALTSAYLEAEADVEDTVDSGVGS
ncbi:cobaltochelatase subunit CobN [Gephyromycinifex aptenodytis]|uniref:cobaltochelatase subunit CobN n=1 Tax=Gephyromycinifex aptenodytis TaxID=2716227 RepID=UPI0014468FF0|nr:cobaltochelatase subunit CobN [Gephyromycinifex aptenodytis]